MDSDYLASGLLSNRQLTKIGFPGWPEPILDSVTGFGASIKKRGLAPAPFSIFKASFPVPPVVPRESTESSQPGQILASGFFPGSIAYQKNERPLGGAAARAWGWRVLQSEVSSDFPAVPLRSRAAGRHTGANKPQPLSYSRKPGQLPATCSVCAPQPLNVDSSPDSFWPVPSSPIPAALCSTEVPVSFPTLSARFLRRDPGPSTKPYRFRI